MLLFCCSPINSNKEKHTKIIFKYCSKLNNLKTTNNHAHKHMEGSIHPQGHCVNHILRSWEVVLDDFRVRICGLSLLCIVAWFFELSILYIKNINVIAFKPETVIILGTYY